MNITFFIVDMHTNIEQKQTQNHPILAFYLSSL